MDISQHTPHTPPTFPSNTLKLEKACQESTHSSPLNQVISGKKNKTKQKTTVYEKAQEAKVCH